MPIHFSANQWDKLKKSYASWWKGDIARPVVKMPIYGAHQQSGKAPEAPLLSQENCNDFNYTAAQIIDAFDYDLSQFEFLGDSFPYVNFDSFGPGIVSAFCGARLDNSSGRVWFFPKQELEAKDIHIEYNPSNMWVERIKEIYYAGNKKWQGQVLMAMPDLGGELDIVAAFRGSENLLMDLYDNPDEVLRLCDEAHTAWCMAYDDLNSVLQPINPGYSDWSGIYSEKPSYILQSDFSYMLGNSMFKQFALPYIKKCCERLENSIYHLDGIPQLNHLNDLLAIEELNAIQFVYGDGQPSARHWIEVYKLIENAHKGNFMIGDTEDFTEIYKYAPKGIFMNSGAGSRQDGIQMLKTLKALD